MGSYYYINELAELAAMGITGINIENIVIFYEAGIHSAKSGRYIRF